MADYQDCFSFAPENRMGRIRFNHLISSSKICGFDFACRSRQHTREKRKRKRERERDVETTTGQCRGEIKIVDPHENDRPENLHLTRTVCVSGCRDGNQICYNNFAQCVSIRHCRRACAPRHRMNINIRARCVSHGTDHLVALARS